MAITIPTTAAECVTQGWASPTELFLCDETSAPLIGEILGTSLAAQDAHSLTNQTFTPGKPAGKKCIQTSSTYGGFYNATALDTVGTNDFTWSMLVCPGSWLSQNNFIYKYNYAGRGYIIRSTLATRIEIVMQDATSGIKYHRFDGHPTFWDGNIHLITWSFDRSGNVSLYIDDAATMNVACQVTGDLTCTSAFGLCQNGYYGAYGFNGQTAWVYFCNNTAVSRTGHDALWLSLQEVIVDGGTLTAGGSSNSIMANIRTRTQTVLGSETSGSNLSNSRIRQDTLTAPEIDSSTISGIRYRIQSLISEATSSSSAINYRLRLASLLSSEISSANTLLNIIKSVGLLRSLLNSFETELSILQENTRLLVSKRSSDDLITAYEDTIDELKNRIKALETRKDQITNRIP